MKTEYLGVIAALLVVLSVFGGLLAFTVVSSDSETSLPASLLGSNCQDPHFMDTNKYTGTPGDYGTMLPGYSKITFDNMGDPFVKTDRDTGSLQVQLIYADSYSKAPAAVVSLTAYRDGMQADASYLVDLEDFDGRVHTKTVTLKPLSYYDTNGDGRVMVKISKSTTDQNFIRIYGVRFVTALTPLEPEDTCQISDCDLDCVGTTKYTNPRCVDGACKYTKTANSPSCGYDPCAGVKCNPDGCEGTTFLYNGVCSDDTGSCVYQEHPDSSQCVVPPQDGDDDTPPTDDGTGTDGEDPIDPTQPPKEDDEMLLIGTLMSGVLAILVLTFIALKMRK